MTIQPPTLQLESAGDPTLDTLLGGGFPTRSLNIIAGEPGSGKTIFTLQMLFKAARLGKKCIYFTTLSEPAMKLVQYMQYFKFFDPDLLDSRLLFVDLGAALREGGAQVIESMIARVEAFEPDLIAVDSFRAIDDACLQGRRALVYDLAVRLAALNATALLIGEYTRSEFTVFPEFAIADGIIRFGVEQHELTSVREFEIVKLRGGNYVSGRHFSEITSEGFSVYPRVRVPDPDPSAVESFEDRARIGVEGLDEMLAGGLPRRSTTVFQGGTGAGKTILALHFLLEGARLGEKGVLFTLEETPAQMRAIASGLGFDLVERERQGLITIRYASPVELSTDRFLFEARRLVEELGARRAVFDSLTSMAIGVSSTRRFKELVYSIAKYLRRKGTTVVMTMESEQFIGTGRLTGHGVSFMADALIQIRYLELEGKLERAVSVIKARGTKHLSSLRSLTIDQGGIRVSEGRFEGMSGILTGMPASVR